MKKILISMFWLFSAMFCANQALAQDEQARLIFHPTIDLGKHWFIACWSITNIHSESPGNTNLFTGLGYRGQTWWFEGMTQRQWSKTGRHQWMLDFRFQKQWNNRVALYVEPTPFLTKRSLYELVALEARIWRGISVGGETENVHREGKDSLGAGPRVSMPIFKKGKARIAAILAYQFRRDEPNVLRLYLVTNLRF